MIQRIINKVISVICEISVFVLYITLFYDLALVSRSTNKDNIVVIIATAIVLNVSAIIAIVQFLRNIINKTIKLKTIFDNKLIIVVMSMFIIVFLTVVNSWLNLDGYIYYTQIRNLKKWDFSWNGLMLAGHMSQGYTILLMIGEFIFQENVLGIRLVQLAMALFSIWQFYRIVVCLEKNRDYVLEALMTAMFGLSPMLLGIIAEPNTDFPLLCFLTCMVSYGMRNKYYAQAISAFMLCFSKETGCIIFGMYAVGILIYKLIKNYEFNVKKIIELVFDRENILMFFAGITWIINYLFGGGIGWATDNTSVSKGKVEEIVKGFKLNSLGVWPKYIAVKLQQLLYINFSWILYFLIVIMIFMCILKGKKLVKEHLNSNGKVFAGLICSFMGFLIYSLFYITYTHYRYTIPYCLFVSYGAVCSIFIVCNRKWMKRLIACILVVILFLSNFYTIDPISSLVFMKQYTGICDILIPNTMLTLNDNNAYIAKKDEYESVIINTSAMYNCECNYLSNCFDKTLKKINYDETKLILMPYEYRDEYGTFASIFGVNLSTQSDVFYWNDTEKKVNVDFVNEYHSGQIYNKLNMKVIKSTDEITQEELAKYKEVYYIALPFDKAFNHNSVIDAMGYIDKMSVSYISWKWDVYRIK